MAGDAFRKVVSGDPLRIPAEAYNAFIDAARATRAQQVLGASAEAFLRQTTICKLRNLTGANLARFAVVGLSSPLVAPTVNETEFLRQPAFDGVTPTSGHSGQFAVLLEPIAAGRIGAAAIAGAIPVKMLVDPLQLYDHAEIAPGVSDCVRNVPHGSARVLWIEPSSGAIRWAVIRLDDSDYEAHVLIISNIPDEEGFYSAAVQRYIGGAWVTQFPCKAIDINA